MKPLRTLLRNGAIVAVATLCLVGLLHAAGNEVPTPKEYGIYVKTGNKLVRVLPNIVFEQGPAIFIESNNPAHFLLKDIRYFVIYGKQDVQYLTLNNMAFMTESPAGRSHFMFGKEVETEVTRINDVLYTVRPKGLFGRGYYALWINDTAWDFVVD